MSAEESLEEIFGEPAERRIGQYLITGTIGFGGMGGVYKAVDERTSEPVAIKILHSDLTLEPDVLERFRREIRILSSVVHENIVHIREYGEHDGLPFLVMEYVSGVALSKLIERLKSVPGNELCARHLLEAARSDISSHTTHPASPRIRPEYNYEQAVSSIGVQLAEALAYLHSKGIIHRDIKPSNVMIRPDGVSVLMDMGVARAHGDSRITGTGRIVGTWRYLAPEQLLDRRFQADEKTDLYQLGATLYELLFLHGFYEGYNETELREAKAREDPCAPKVEGSAPSRVAQIVLRCLLRDRARRYDSAAQLAAELGLSLSAR